MQEVGERLLKCRSRAFISRKELSKRTGVTIEAIRQMERGQIESGIETAVKICEGLEYSVEYILTGKCGLSEYIKMQQHFCKVSDVNCKNLEKVAKAFWETCPRYFR